MTSASRAAAQLEGAAFALLAALPLAMALANRSATLVVVLAALLAAAGRVVTGETGLLVVGLRAALGRPIALACLAYLAIALLSIGWSHHVKLSLAMFGEVALAALAPVVLHVALPRRLPGWLPLAAAALLGLGCITILAELATGMAAREMLGLRAATFIFKRSVASILLVYWPVAALLWLTGRRALAPTLGALLLAAILAGHAGAALVGAAAGLACLVLVAASRRVGTGVAALALVAALAVAPAIGDLAGRALPGPLLDRLESVQARDRIAIWQSFGSAVAARPLVGSGFGTSAALAQDPVAAQVPPERRLLLGAGHPHNGYLQVWTETGLAGAALAALVLACLVALLVRAAPAAALPGAAALASAATIMLVGHGAWQGWWITTIGAVAVWCARLPQGSVSETVPRNPVAST